jgi:hypothetical protein
LAGMAPWLDARGVDAAESSRVARYADLARQAIDAATDPVSPDCCVFNEGMQPLVDASFLSHAILRAPDALWKQLPSHVQTRVIDAVKSTRVITPPENNWHLFAATVEALLHTKGEAIDVARVDTAINRHEQWYKGDGAYGDGPDFHWDYYNSFVIQPLLVDVCETLSGTVPSCARVQERVVARAIRFAEVQERLIGVDGSFPPIGRSLSYRCGAFQLLAQMALSHRLPQGVRPSQVRGALAAVIRRTLDVPGTFDDAGWPRVGLSGHQPSLAEPYITTGSLYLCSTAFLPLGLPPTDPFWADSAEPWTSQKAWGGVDLPADHALASHE